MKFNEEIFGLSLFVQKLESRDHKNFFKLWFSLWSRVSSVNTVEYFNMVL